MSPTVSGRSNLLRQLIHRFIDERKQAKLESLKKLPPEDPQFVELAAKYLPAAWLDDAARRSSQLQVVTHALKGSHPDAKGSSLCCDPAELPAHAEVGSHCLPPDAERDVVGNAAALDVYKLLKLRLEGEDQSLLALAQAQDADWLAALSDDADQARRWSDAFAAMAQQRGVASSHQLAKQVYWRLSGQNEADDPGSYHLLAPLYPTGLVHRVHKVLEAHRFGEAAKAAREARKTGQWHPQPVHDYPHLLLQKLGGTKPQNISQLNSERRGNTPLLASVPPQWNEGLPRPPLRVSSLFHRLRSWPGVRDEVDSLAKFLLTDPDRVEATRDRVQAHVRVLVDALIELTAWTRELEPGWSLDPSCALPIAQRQWLDPEAQAIEPQARLFESVAADFGVWLNDALRQRFKGDRVMDASTAREWTKAAEDLLRDLEPELSHAD
jgi:CRISPR-associated protein Csy1